MAEKVARLAPAQLNLSGTEIRRQEILYDLGPVIQAVVTAAGLEDLT